jgi:hypothetical protein
MNSSIDSFPAPDRFPAQDPWCDQEVVIPYQGQQRMRLHFAKGVSELSLRVGAAETALLRGHFAGVGPRISVGADEILVRYRFGVADWLGGLLWAAGVGATVVLHPAVDWELVFHGGASQVDVDLRGGRVTALEIAGGASEVRLSLPTPDAVVPLRVRGGASELAIRRPPTVPFGLQLRGGASGLEVDGQHIGAVGGPIALESDGWPAAQARYDLKVTGGASELCVCVCV